jgi:hypothetical protein
MKPKVETLGTSSSKGDPSEDEAAKAQISARHVHSDVRRTVVSTPDVIRFAEIAIDDIMRM